MRYRYKIRVRVLTGILAGVTTIQFTNALYEVGKVYTTFKTAEKYIIESLEEV